VLKHLERVVYDAHEPVLEGGEQEGVEVALRPRAGLSGILPRCRELALQPRGILGCASARSGAARASSRAVMMGLEITPNLPAS
jgi:hypothetical protein